MPADENKLSDTQKDVIRRWIVQGAHDAKSVMLSERKKEQIEISFEKRGVETIQSLIDQRIERKLKEASLITAPTCDDATFLRRVSLDLIGRAPNYQETVSFLGKRSPSESQSTPDLQSQRKRRSELIDQLLASQEFGDHFAIVWHKLLIPKSSGAYRRIPHRKFREWLSESFHQNRSWDEIVTDLVTAEGYLPSNKDNENTRKQDAKRQPQNVATAFINAHNTQGRPQPKGIVASVSRLFMAQSIECAQCHNHPLAKWKQTDFWAAAAFFERIRYEKAVFGDDQIGKLIEPSEGKDLVYEDKKAARYAFVPGVYEEPVIDLEDANEQRTGKMIRAAFLDGTSPEFDSENKHRKHFAEWMTSTENPYFAKAMVNRIWSQLLGRGFVEPVDDMSEDNPSSHPQLLEELTVEFAASGYDIKHLVRCITNSETYQRSSERNLSLASDSQISGQLSEQLFQYQALKQLTEEQLLSTLQTTLPTFAKVLEEDAKDKNPNLFRKEFLEVYEAGSGPLTEHTRGLQQALRMMNGDGKHWNREALADWKKRSGKNISVEQRIEQIYLQILNRFPTSNELTRMSEFVQAATLDIEELYKGKRKPESRKKGHPDNTPDPYSDLIWVLVNSGEFIFNH